MNSSTDRVEGSLWHLQTEHIQDSCLILTMLLIILIYSSRFVPFLCRSEFSQCKLLRCRCLLLYASWSCWLESWGPQVTRLPHVTGVSLTWDLDVLGSLYRLTKPDIEGCSPTMYCTWLHDLARWTGLGLLKTMITSRFFAHQIHIRVKENGATPKR